MSCVSCTLRLRAESTIHATATKVENYDGRLEVDKRFSSLVSYFITYQAEIKFIENTWNTENRPFVTQLKVHIHVEIPGTNNYFKSQVLIFT